MKAYIEMGGISPLILNLGTRRRCVQTRVQYSTIQYSMPDESGLHSAHIWHTVLYCAESDETRCCDNTICPPEDENVNARNMSRIVM